MVCTTFLKAFIFYSCYNSLLFSCLSTVILGVNEKRTEAIIPSHFFGDDEEAQDDEFYELRPALVSSQPFIGGVYMMVYFEFQPVVLRYIELRYVEFNVKTGPLLIFPAIANRLKSKFILS